MQKLIAECGMVYTNGETYGSEIYLPDSADSSVWWQIEEPKEGEFMKYSTLSIKRELANIGKWDATKELLTASGYWDDYILANYLAENDHVFKVACDALVAHGILTAEEIKALLPKCLWNAAENGAS